jgi:hypothetical protein
VTLTFGLGALVLSAAMGVMTYLAARQVIIHQRDTSVLHQAYVNASLVRSALRSPHPQIPQLLDSLDTLPGSRSVLEQRSTWFATSISIGRDALPAALRQDVVVGSPATQVFLVDGTPELAVGVPVPSVSAAYFEVFSYSDISRTLKILAIALAGAALVTTVAGALIGRLLSARALRPLYVASDAAVSIAGGHLDTRIPTDDADLVPIAASFNHMVDALQARIERSPGIGRGERRVRDRVEMADRDADAPSPQRGERGLVDRGLGPDHDPREQLRAHQLAHLGPIGQVPPAR